MTTKLPSPLPRPTVAALLSNVRAAAAKSAATNQAIKEAAAKLAGARRVNTGSGDGSGSGAAGPPNAGGAT